MTNNGKAKIEKTSNGLNITIPSKKSWFILLFMTACMGGWLFYLIDVVGILFSEIDLGNVDLFLILWLIAWIAGGLTIACLLLWGYFGQEKFIIGKDKVSFEKTVFGIGKKNRLDVSGIKNFRTELVNGDLLIFRSTPWGLGTSGKIKFDYGLKTYSFGLGIDDAEANYIVGLLKEQFKEQ